MPADDDVIARMRTVRAAAAPGPWEYREHEGLAAIACPGGWALEDGNPHPELPDKRLVVLAANALPALLDVLEAAHAEAEPVRGCASELRIAVDRALAALRAEVEQ